MLYQRNESEVGLAYYIVSFGKDNVRCLSANVGIWI